MKGTCMIDFDNICVVCGEEQTEKRPFAKGLQEHDFHVYHCSKEKYKKFHKHFPFYSLFQDTMKNKKENMYIILTHFYFP